MSGGFEKKLIVPVADGKHTEQEIVDPDAMHRLFLIAASVASHEEVSRWDVDTRWRCGDVGQWTETPDFGGQA